MKRTNRFILATLSFIALTSNLPASAALRLSGGTSFGVDILDSSASSAVTLITGTVGAAYISPIGLEFGGDFALTSASSDGSSISEYSILATTGFNFGAASLDDSFFVRLGLGLYGASSGGNSDSAFTVRPVIGKRVQITQGVSWSPEFAFQLITTDPSISRIRILPLSFTFIL